MSTGTQNKSRNYAGTKDWFGSDVEQRSFVTETANQVFQSFGYEPLETPIIELSETLSGKYGEEGNKTMYLFTKGGENIGLRYDQTVPLARVAAQYSNDLILPYRRYAIGPVFRADTPQAGRYRQFTQIDFDVLGVESILADAEIIAMLYKITERLGFKDFKVLVSDRALLTGMAQQVRATTKEQILTAIRGWDKLSKVGINQVLIEVGEVGIDKNLFSKLTEKLLKINGSNTQIIDAIDEIFGENKIAKEGINRLRKIVELVEKMKVSEDKWKISPTLARGLDYYTGPIFEVEAGKGMGSIAGGGRYDNLIETLGGPSITGTGASFGLERVISVMNQQNLNVDKKGGIDVFVTVFSEDCLTNSVAIATKLRENGLAVEIDQTMDKLGKQFKLADKRQVKIAIVLGPDEIKEDKVTLKYLQQSQGGTKQNQETISMDNLLEKIKLVIPSVIKTS